MYNEANRTEITRIDICRDINKAVMEISWRAINATFLLNGAASTAILTQDAKWPAIFFALGALSAILSFGFAYCTNLALLEQNKPEGMQKMEYRIIPWGRFPLINKDNAEWFRQKTICLWLGAIAFFIVGLPCVLASIPR